MKKVIVVLLMLGTLISFAFAHTAENSLSRALSEGSRSEKMNRPDISAEAITQLFRNQGVVTKSRWKPKSETSTNITLTVANGVTVHVALYPDVGIATALDGPKAGMQIISNDYNTNHPSVKDSSFKVEVRSNCVVHSYSWGKVYSYGNYKQDIKVKK